MDVNLVDKLRILNVDSELRVKIKMKPISRYYFLMPTNIGEQFFMFASTSAWLLRKLGREFEQPIEEDDSNEIIANIMDAMKELGHNVEFSSHKLKQGYGEHVEFILNTLANAALANIKWKKPVPVDEPDEDTAEDQIEDESDIFQDGDNVLNYENTISSDDEEHNEADIAIKTEVKSEDRTLVDLENWKLEIERVGTSLRITLPSDHEHWRQTVAQMEQNKKELCERCKTATAKLQKLQSDTAMTLQRIVSRETILNEQFSTLIAEYATLNNQLATLNEEYKSVSSGVTERQQILNELNSKIDIIKQKTESKGSLINDNSALVNIKQSVGALKKDIKDMNTAIVILMWQITSKGNNVNDLTTRSSFIY